MKLSFVPVRVNKDSGLTRENTQRSRSFLFASLGAAVAHMVGRDRLRFYENGVVSLNLPLADQVIGARASRTTHPRVLAGFGRLFTLLAGRSFAVENPFQWHTKEQVVREITDARCGQLIRDTVSCAHPRPATGSQPHCGLCSQCIDRRFAVLAAGQRATDPADGYAVDLIRGERAAGEPRTMLSIYVQTAMAVSRMDATAFLSRYGETVRALRHLGGAFQTVAERVFEMHRRHEAGVVGVVTQAIRDHADEILWGSLPPSCLVRLAKDQGSPPPPLTAEPVAECENYFRLEGGAWRVRFNGRAEFVLLPCRGAEYLAVLLSQPGTPIAATESVARVGGRQGTVIDRNNGEVIDRQALKAYRHRIAENEEEQRHRPLRTIAGRAGVADVDLRS